MLALVVRLLLVGTPVLSEADLRIVERLAWRAGVPRGAVESLSTDVTGDGAPDVILLTRTGDRLVLFLAEGPVSPVGRWWRVDLHRGTGAGELCVPASAARVHVEDHAFVSAALECDRERTGPCRTRRACALHPARGREVRALAPAGPEPRAWSAHRAARREGRAPHLGQRRAPGRRGRSDGARLHRAARADVDLAPARGGGTALPDAGGRAPRRGQPRLRRRAGRHGPAVGRARAPLGAGGRRGSGGDGRPDVRAPGPGLGAGGRALRLTALGAIPAAPRRVRADDVPPRPEDGVSQGPSVDPTRLRKLLEDVKRGRTSV